MIRGANTCTFISLDKSSNNNAITSLVGYVATQRKDRIRNDDIRDKLGVASIQEKLVQHRLRWFGHIQRKPPEAPVRGGILSRPENTRRGRGRPRLTWEETIKRDLKE
jgi:hypothetical protein